MTLATKELIVHLRNPDTHAPQKQFVESTFKRVIVKAGRRGGKTVGAAIKAVKGFLAGRRVLYAAPTSEQTDKFWYEVKRALAEPVEGHIFKQNDSEQFIERPGTENRIKAKTAWNANTLRGDYADLLILDEFQLMAEDAWDEVGAPMLLDNNGDACFIFTPPSLRASGISKAKDPRHASKFFKIHEKDPMWECIHFSSHENPFISTEALAGITQDMSLDSYRREIMAEDDEIETSWLVYSKFNEGLCKRPRSRMPADLINWPVYSGHDFGAANPAALFIARDPANGDLHIFKEYAPGPGQSIAKNVEAFQEIVANRKEIIPGRKITKSVGGNVTTEDEIRQGYTAHGWQIIPPAWSKVNVQIERVIALMERNRIIIYDDLFHLLSEIANCMWVLDSENKPTDKIKDESRYHLLAALRYIGSDFTPETVVRGKEPTAVSNH